MSDGLSKYGHQSKNKSERSGLFMFPAYVAGAVAAGLQISTQAAASMFNYHPGLGVNWNGLYAPWKIVTWFDSWGWKYPDIFIKSGSFGMLFLALLMVVSMYYKAAAENRAKSVDDLHASARWATKDDIIRMGLLHKTHSGKPGVIVGGWLEPSTGILHYLTHFGPEHILTYAPTRSGKGVGLVIPTLLSWNHSVVVSDIKSELYELTAGWRKSIGQKVIRFQPASRLWARWNPLDEVRTGTSYEVADVQNICLMLVDPDGKGIEGNHWRQTSYELLVGLVLHALYRRRKEGDVASLPVVDKMLTNREKTLDELWEEMQTYPHCDDGSVHPVISQAAQSIKNKPEDERGSVISTATTALGLYRDPEVAYSVGSSDFSIRDLMHHETPVSLYLVIPPADKRRLIPILRIFYSMMIQVLATGMEFEGGEPKKTYNYRLLGMLDEFPSLGKMDSIQDGLAYIAGYGIKLYMITQDTVQLKSEKTGYGRDELITGSTHIQNSYPPINLDTAKYMSEKTGYTTVVKQEITTSGKKNALSDSNVTRSKREYKRALLTPDECLTLPGPKKDPAGDKIIESGDMLIHVAGFPAIYGKQLLWFKDEIFKKRVKIPAPKESDILSRAARKVSVNL